MTDLAKQILNIIQNNFPVVAEPFAAIADELSSTPAAIIATITDLVNDGIIRRIGPVFNAKALGYASTLVAAAVPQAAIADFVATVNAIAGVSHNYHRQHRLNIWFTLTLPGLAAIEATIANLQKQFNLTEIYNLPALQTFKLNVNFDMHKQQSAATTKTFLQPEPQNLTPQQIQLIRQLQKDLPLQPRPFVAIADALAMPESEILQTINHWLSNGTIRRFGAMLRHRQVGFNSNGMATFQISPENIIDAGQTLMQYPQISHCYQRPSYPAWPYNLFAMTHSPSPDELMNIYQDMTKKINPIASDILLSTQEYKKTSVKYFLD